MSEMDSERLPEKPTEKHRNFKLLLGGGLTIIAGVLAIINGLRGISLEESIGFRPGIGFNAVSLCGGVLVLFGIVAIAGGVCAIRGRYLTLYLAGAVTGILGGGLFGFWLGLAAIALFFLSNEDISD